MTIDDIRGRLPDTAKDIRLNLGSVLTAGGAPGLTETQIWGVAATAALAARRPDLAQALENSAGDALGPADRQGVRTAAALMGMNNIYYRFVHLTEDPEYASLPARLRMNAMARPGVDKVDFELYSLAASAVTGCGMCIKAHEKTLRQHGLSREGVQSVARIAAVIHATAQLMDLGLESAAEAA